MDQSALVDKIILVDKMLWKYDDLHMFRLIINYSFNYCDDVII